MSAARLSRRCCVPFTRSAFADELSAPSKGQEFGQRTPGKVDDDLMMLQSLAALDRPQVPDDAVMAVAHSSYVAVFEVPHPVRMHRPAIPSILDCSESI
jgi:hypothetical protein